MRSMIVAPQPLAVEEGAKVLQAGGNAFDAAIVCAFVQGVVSPQMCGIGGYITLTACLGGDSDPIHLDAPALAGSKTTPDMWQDLVIRANPGGWGYQLKGRVNDVGYRSICTPGASLGLASALERWGTLNWWDAIEPAARLAEEGFQVDSYLGSGLSQRASSPEVTTLLDLAEANREAGRIYLKEGRQAYQPGDVLRNPDLAATLHRLAEGDPEDFHRGEIAERIARDLEANGSYVTADDLEGYRLPSAAPVLGTYRGYTIASAPPPHGGATLIAMLNILEGYDLAGMGHNSPGYIYLLSQAMKAAFADRNPYVGDPRFVDVPLQWMVAKERAAEWRRRIDAGEAIEVSFTPAGSPTTTHVSVVDKGGICVALTHSLGAGSGVITPGMGFMYNNSMVNFHPYPGHPNSIAPGKGRTTGMSPTIVFDGQGRPVLVVGAPGATRIITSLVQVIVNHLDFGMSIGEAVYAPRIDCQVNTIRCQARIPEFVCAEVRRRHPIERMPQSHGGHGLVHAIAIDPKTGHLSGGADPGSGGMALEV